MARYARGMRSSLRRATERSDDARAPALLDVTVNGTQAGDLATASLVPSTRFIELDAAVWSNNTVRLMAQSISAAAFDLTVVTLSVRVTKRRVP